MTNEIRGYFERYGEIQSIHFRANFDNFRFGFVKFKNAADAAKVLSKSRHRIGNCKVKVDVAWSQPADDDISETDSEDDNNWDYYDSDY